MRVSVPLLLIALFVSQCQHEAKAFEPKIVRPPCAAPEHVHLTSLPPCSSPEGRAAIDAQIRALTPIGIEEETICNDLGDCLTRRVKLWGN